MSVEIFNKIEVCRNIVKKWYFVKKNFTFNQEKTSNYIIYRVLRPILKMNFRIFRLLNYPCPWIAPAGTKILSKILNKNQNCLEYGSGISTIFLSKKVKELVSIEHCAYWYNKTEKLLSEKQISNVDFRFVPGNEIKEIPKKSTKKEQHEIQFGSSYFDYKKYETEVNSFPNDYFDVAIIDGRSRVQCLKNSLPKVKEGGIIVLDNSERTHYQKIHEPLADFPKINTTTGLTDTTFWFKIAKSK